ncbi:Conserved_hypothetical protein [Hexamita inflata]|uniref:Dynein regulatory complex subunit 2 n=1 Tax=Hexamita inflata TaxID=28002 RepID=A0AA86Q3S0_9EUKA|nr:Conserved hypothetical protein [Hexamita inflata]CAI9934427.1 Conserved hypothetical protein [Hexamita inflata]CAI9951675.1 Conserved hypothetical protein [Hexamita inflata]
MQVPDLNKQGAEEVIRQRQLKQQEYLARLLETEAQLNIHNRNRVNDLIRTRLRQTKTNELRTELEELKTSYERNIERKDAVVALLARYISIAEDQRKRSVQSHSQVVSDLLGLLNDRMHVFEYDAEDQIARLKAQFDQELHSLSQVYDQRIKTSNQIKQATINEENELIESLKSDYTAKLNEIQSMNKEQFNITQLHLQEQNTELEHHLLEEHEKYKQQTESKQHQFKILLIKDQQSSNAIEENKQKIDRLQKQISHWKSKIQQTTDEFREKNTLLKKEKDDANREYANLKNKLNKFRKDENTRQRALANDAHEAEDRIVALKEQAERIIRLSVLCSRLETEAERVNEVERLDLQQRREIEQEVERMKQEDGGWLLGDGQVEAEEQVVKAAKELQFVYKKLSNATIDRLALTREQKLLEMENQELREALQRFLSVGTVGGV